MLKIDLLNQYLAKDMYITLRDVHSWYLNNTSDYLNIDEDIDVYFDNIRTILDKHNEQYVNRHLILYKEYLDNIYKDIDSSIRLDINQRKVILHDNSSMLVIAGAGCGKTSTIVAKIKYLNEIKKISYNDILVISFTNEACNEIVSRISTFQKETSSVTTFHKLGLDILKCVYPSISICSDNYIDKVIKEYYNNINIININMMIYIILYLRVIKLSNNKVFFTLSNKIVKSIVLLVLYDLYYILGNKVIIKSTLLPNNTYHINVRYKERNNNYDYVISDNTIVMSLINHIIKEHNKIDYSNISLLYNKCISLYCDEVNTLSSNIKRFIKLYKENNECYDNHITNTLSVMQLLELIIIKDVYSYYNKCLLHSNLIDFEDMINIASLVVSSSKYDDLISSFTRFKYIFIDEYQDISNNRFNLSIALVNKCNAKIICVGDDYQSIYRFSGSHIELFQDFINTYNSSIVIHITNTYRNSLELVNVAGRFIKKNNSQIDKVLYSSKRLDKPLVFLYYKVISNISSCYTKLLDKLLFSIINEYISKGKNTLNVAILSRYHFDLNIKTKYFNYVPNSKTYYINNFTNIKVIIYLLTIHESKGLGFDEVIILNNTFSIYGFPSNIESNSVVDKVYRKDETYDYAEERRLMYVALTRTKNHVYFFVPNKNESIFIKELYNDCSLFIEVNKKYR